MSAVPNFYLLDECGLNMQAIFNLAELPEEIRIAVEDQVQDYSDYTQLILIAHGGRCMWKAVQASEFRGVADPIDSFSVNRVKRWAAEEMPEVCSEIIYPAPNRIVPLQALGGLAGWHHDSPFRIGINWKWGSWFAYRVAVLVDTDFDPTERMDDPSPCDSCIEKPCLTVCPACLPDCGEISMGCCINYRLSDGSACKTQCLARSACPVAPEHRYSNEQIDYHYGRSMRTIEAWQKNR
ncbi:hypothetical protein [Mariprofundus ferrinatatus]|nr:hypothetical protein [Mariprofundus ferrinatatus]